MSKKIKVIAVSAPSLTELCEKIEANVNDGGFSWDGRWQYTQQLYRAAMTRDTTPYSPNRPGPR